MTAGVEVLGPALVALPFVVVGAAVALVGGRKLVRGLALWRSEPISVLEAANTTGTVELTGTARPYGDPIESPFERLDCLAFEYEIEEHRPSDEGSDWDTLETGSEGARFRLEDDTGAIVVDPTDGTLQLSTQGRIAVGTTETEPDHVRAFLEGTGVEPSEVQDLSVGPVDLTAGDRRRYTEYRLEPGDPVHVYGPVERSQTVADAGGDVNALVSDQGRGTLLVSDTEESATIRRNLLAGAGLLAFGLVFVAVGVAVALSGL